MNSADLVLCMIKSVITETSVAPVSDTETLDYATLFHIAQAHDMTALVSQGLYQNNIFPAGEWGARFKAAQFHALRRCTQIDAERALVCGTLTEADIRYVLLKGSVLKDFYPESYMRTQCDIDILVKEETLARVQELFITQLNFVHVETSNHDVAFRTPRGVRVELHYALLEEANEQIDAVLATAWEHVTYREDNCCHGQLSWEFFVFYHIAHMEKHFLHGGCGIKPLVDLWVLSHKIGFDEKQVETLCARCGLVTFLQESLHLCRVWFDGEPHTKLTQAMENYIFGAGVYGALENEVAISQIKRGGRWGHLLHKIFVDYSTLKVSYPPLARMPFLFPFYQVVRWMRLLFTDERKRVANEINTNHTISEEKRQEIAFLCKQLDIV